MFFQLLTSFRNTLYDKGVLPIHRVDLPVICVGNVTVGGNGKTPLTMMLAKYCMSRSVRPVILSRGYGGKERGPYRIHGGESPDICGDEPLMMKIQLGCEVVIARDRVAGARYCEEHDLGDLILLDDGFQHRRLHRDLDIICQAAGSEDAIMSFLSGKLLPLGRFREDRDRALKRADLIVWSHRKPREEAELDTRLVELLPKDMPDYESSIVDSKVISVDSQEELSPQSVYVFCSIAQPQGFYETLERIGFSLVGSRSYSDHYQFRTADIDSLRAEAGDHRLVCTRKDLVKIPEEQRSNLAVLDIETVVSDSESFYAHIERFLKKAA